MAIVTTDNEHYKSIVTAIRKHSHETRQFKPSEMPEGVDLVAIIAYAEGDMDGYAVGYQEGVADGYDEGEKDGKQAEYDAFWDIFQTNGEPSHYYYKFSYDCWTDENYNPKYPIVTKNNNTAGQYLFYSNKSITDTKVPIEVLGVNATSMFYGATALVTIQKLVLHMNVTLKTAFSNCTELQNLTIDGEIGQDINLQSSPLLTVESAKSVILHLKDSTGTEHEYGKSVYLHDDIWDRLEADSTAPNGDTWKNYVQYVLKWNI